MITGITETESGATLPGELRVNLGGRKRESFREREGREGGKD